MIADYLRARRAEDAGQVELGKELRLGDAHLRVGADQLLFDLAEVGPALEQGGGQPGRHRGDDGLSVHRRAAWNRRGRLAEKDADLVLLRDDPVLELGDVRLRPAQRALGPGGLELGGQPEPQAILEQVVGALKRLGAVARDLDLHVQREQLEVRLSQVADQRQPHAAPRLFGGQQVRARGLVGSADAPPDVQLPLGGERPQEEVRRGVLRHIGRDPERGHGVATAGHGEVVADLREELRARHPDLGARFLYAGGGDLHVVVAGERFLDEVLQDGVLEHLPPRQVRERRRLRRRLAAERRDLGHGRTLVVGADRAAGEQRRGDDRAPGRPGPHGRTPPAGGSSSAPPEMGAGAGTGGVAARSDLRRKRSLT